MKMKDFARNFIIQGITSQEYFSFAYSNNSFFSKSVRFFPQSEGPLGKLKMGSSQHLLILHIEGL